MNTERLKDALFVSLHPQKPWCALDIDLATGRPIKSIATHQGIYASIHHGDIEIPESALVPFAESLTKAQGTKDMLDACMELALALSASPDFASFSVTIATESGESSRPIVVYRNDVDTIAKVVDALMDISL